jgi:hypothetical protein
VAPEPWLSKREIAKAFEVSTRTVERQAWPCLVVGGQNRYLRTQVEAYLLGVPEDGGDVIRFPRERTRNVAA